MVGLKEQVGYQALRCSDGQRHVVSSHRLQRQFNPVQLDRVWVTDITYICVSMKGCCIWYSSHDWQTSLTVDPNNKKLLVPWRRRVSAHRVASPTSTTIMSGSTTMEKYTTNTLERFKAYMAFNATLSGM